MSARFAPETVTVNIMDIPKYREALEKAGAEITYLRSALVQAFDRMETAWNLMHPVDLTLDEREAIAQSLWFGMDELGCLIDDQKAAAVLEAKP